MGQPPKTSRLRWSRFRLLALSLALVAIPAILSSSAFLREAPIRVDEPSPRTVIAPDLIRTRDDEATTRARRDAADAVIPVRVDDPEARAAIVQEVREAFALVAAVRQPAVEGEPPTAEAQVAALGPHLPVSAEALQQLIAMPDALLRHVSAEAVAATQQLARQEITDASLPDVRGRQLTSELSLRALKEDVARDIVAPVVQQALRATVGIDEGATARARQRAADDVAVVVRTFPKGSAIVTAGESPDTAQVAALRSRGLEGAEPWWVVLRSLLVAGGLAAVVASVLRTRFPDVWRSGRRLLLLAGIVTLFVATTEALWLAVSDRAPQLLFLVPAGAVAMLTAVLFNPGVASLLAAPATVLVAYAMPGRPAVAAFTAAAYLGSVPLAVRLGAWGGFTRVAWQSSVVYGAAAGTAALAFGPADSAPLAIAAGLGSALLTALIVNGSLPFMESLFGIVTPSSLMRLSNRNHPLLRELEQKALGSYNHSIMVATLCERACRAIDADGLLASTAALYHDIGKVRRPYFFVENQFGVANPHDDLEPRVSALIIQEHVTDGVEMARTFRLPPEIVEGIATHHGTTVVSYFHNKAVQRYGGHQVTEEEFRYPGRKPASREMAVLMLADCCEGAARAAAIENRNLTQTDVEDIVNRLVDERLSDGQLDESALTMKDVRAVRASLIETLVGVYHPRIAYPDPKVPDDDGRPGAPDAPDAPGPRRES